MGRGSSLRNRLRLMTAAMAVLSLLAVLELSGCDREVINRRDPVNFETLGDSAMQRQDYDTALREYNRAMELGSQKLKIYNNIGNVYFKRGQYELAEKNYRLALKIDPTYIFSLNNLALTLYGLRNVEEARKLLLDTLKTTSGSALLYNTLGWMLIKEGDLKTGVGYLKKAVEVNPDYAVALNNLGDVFVNNPDLGEDPLPLISRAIQRDPENRLFYDTLGWYHCLTGDFEEAVVEVGKAVAQDPEDTEVRAHYATVLEWLGKEQEALKQWQEIMEMPANKDIAAMARKHYWELKGR